MDKHAIRPLEEKVEVVRQFPQPQMQRKLHQFLGLVNFYYQFILGCARIVYRLNAILSGPSQSDRHIVWTPAQRQLFSNSRMHWLLLWYTLKPTTGLFTDVSDLAVGAVLQQQIGSVWSPLAFFSRKLKPAETRYSMFDRELLAVYLAIRHFCFTRWLDAIPLPDIMASTVAQAFVHGWISRSDVPSTITTERDAQFEYEVN